ncbi:3,4-dihydroxy-2-butanone-4-phosphate synthase [Enterobacteriaceae bacterium ET-AT1-13]|nr:3,4-dihydroxy-2-butanone-4-phosphate synthase [Enterobacteriaceae bacterium ET-AT1-13]WGS66529.1 3,4-dihydroxy-2-butanone-4-phosphate synthase [Enterobacteriaceae bacterium Cmel17]WMC17555.1 MAG: 3,4-dihydroxy-2-butanone-4-phosphate synthase [Enterobacteriaceae bacterium Cmel21]WMC17759.1 MAG: 3,4-dihydroxy-2-butanone-4-phosphate synthase [Enterobacteriaceae bacterium PSmelAO3-2]WMC17963.1 MAG: 3,4-dihydroxy-2-butanone-4-phosphate synthase [Enterobacteriaceae bacterium PSmelAO3-1]WMC18165.1
MIKKILIKFGSPIERVKNAIKALKRKRGVILLDDKNRENEGDIIFSAENITTEQMALTINYGSGIVCVCITEKFRKYLSLPLMVNNNSSKFQTPFTISVESKKNVTTGVSANDRVKTIHTIASNNIKNIDLNKPGHVFPLCAQPGGLLIRKGHTEAAIDLLSLANFKKIGVICELTNKNGSMSKIIEIINFAKKYNMTVLTIEDIIIYMYYQNNKIKF